MHACALALAVAIISAGKVPQDKVAELARAAGMTPAAFVDFGNRCEKCRLGAIAALGLLVKTARNSGDEELAEMAAARRKELLARVRIAFPPLATTLKARALGGIPDARAKIVSVSGPSSLIVEINFATGQDPKVWGIRENVCIEGINTDGLKEGTSQLDRYFTSFDCFEVVGTRAFATVVGSSRTLSVLKPFDEAPLAAYLQMLHWKRR